MLLDDYMPARCCRYACAYCAAGHFVGSLSTEMSQCSHAFVHVLLDICVCSLGVLQQALKCLCAMQVKLLQFVRPQDFENFKHFVRWRDTTANILLQILQRAAQVPASEDDKYDC